MDQNKPPKNVSRGKGASLHPNDVHLPREKLPEDLQKLVDNEESLLDQLYDGS